MSSDFEMQKNVILVNVPAIFAKKAKLDGI